MLGSSRFYDLQTGFSLQHIHSFKRRKKNGELNTNSTIFHLLISEEIFNKFFGKRAKLMD